MTTDIPGIQTGHLPHKSLERCQYIGLLNEAHMYSDSRQRIVSSVLVSKIERIVPHNSYQQIGKSIIHVLLIHT